MVQQLPKSGAKAAHRLKAGHPPAGAHGGRTHSGFQLSTPPSEESHETELKAGGKRVAKKGFEENPTHTTPEKDAKKSDKISKSLATPNRMQQVGILLTGTLDKLSHDFPETPVSVRHCKVRPAVEKTHSPRIFFIQQPRKY